MKVWVDKREKNSTVASELVNLGVEVEFKHLISADYVISEEIGIERKTIDDFVSSMLNKRLLLQLEDLKKNFKKPLLVIEGAKHQDLYHPVRHPNMHENSIRGMILRAALDFGVSVILTQDQEDTAVYLQLLAKRIENPPQKISLRHKRRAFNMKEQQQMILEGFPGIGPSLAKNILKNFKTLKGFSQASVEDLEKVPKLGKKKAVIIKALLDKNY